MKKFEASLDRGSFRRKKTSPKTVFRGSKIGKMNAYFV
jgi:hypothetical protein